VVKIRRNAKRRLGRLGAGCYKCSINESMTTRITAVDRLPNLPPHDRRLILTLSCRVMNSTSFPVRADTPPRQRLRVTVT
jgi:hypothetical protein